MRIYDNKYLSVTSVIGLRKPFNEESFKNWCKQVGKDPEMILSTSQILGSKVSEALDNVSRGLEWLTAPPIDQVEENLLSAVDCFLEEYKPVKTEGVVKCEELNYAGRYDGIVEDRKTGKTLLADWKTYGAWRNKKYKRSSAKIRKAKWQLSMYSYAMDWENDLAVIVFKNDGTWELEQVDYDEDMIDWVRNNQDLILSVVENGKTKKVVETTEILRE